MADILDEVMQANDADSGGDSSSTAGVTRGGLGRKQATGEPREAQAAGELREARLLVENAALRQRCEAKEAQIAGLRAELAAAAGLGAAGSGAAAAAAEAGVAARWRRRQQGRAAAAAAAGRGLRAPKPEQLLP